jgi:hypothetical protein
MSKLKSLIRVANLKEDRNDLHQIGKDVVDGIQLIKKEIEDYNMMRNANAMITEKWPKFVTVIKAQERLDFTSRTY